MGRVELGTWGRDLLLRLPPHEHHGPDGRLGGRCVGMPDRWKFKFPRGRMHARNARHAVAIVMRTMTTIRATGCTYDWRISISRCFPQSRCVGDMLPSLTDFGRRDDAKGRCSQSGLYFPCTGHDDPTPHGGEMCWSVQ